MALTAGSIEIKIFAGLARLQSDMNKANKTVDAAMRNIDKSVSLAKSAFTGLAGTVTLGNIVKLADEYKRFDSQIQLSTKNLNTYNEAYANVIRISKTAQSDINAVGVFYARLNNNMRDLNVTQKQVADVTETVAYTLRANNATVQETSSVMLQLSQSFGSGKLNGQEFLAVAEGAPMLLRQLANSMGKPFGALKDLSAQGKITREDLLKAFSDPEYKRAVENQVKQVGTISSAMTVFTNNLKVFIGEQDKASGASKVIINVIKLLADNINILATGAIVLLISRFGTLIGSIWASIQASKARQIELAKETALLGIKAKAEAEAAVEMQLSMANNAKATTMWAARNSALMAETAAVTAAVSSQVGILGSLKNVGSITLASLGNWVGIITTALMLGITAWTAWGSAGKASASEVAEIIDRINKGLESINDVKLIELQQKALKAEKEAAIEREKRITTTGARRALSPDQQTKAALEYALNLERIDRELAKNDEALAKHNTNLAEVAALSTDAAKAYQRLSEAKLILDEEIAKQEAIIADAKLAREAGLSWAAYTNIVEDARQKIAQLRENKQTLTNAQKEEAAANKDLFSDYSAIRKELEKLTKVEGDEISVLQARIDKLKDMQSPERAHLQYLLDLAIAQKDAIENEKLMKEVQDSADEEQKRSDSVIQEYEKILRETEDINASMIINDKERALKQAEIAHNRRLEEYAFNKEMTEAELELMREAENERYEAAKKAIENLKDEKALAKELQMTFSSAFEDAIVKGKDFREVLSGIEQDIIRIVTRTLVTKPFSDWLSKQMEGFDFGNILGSFPMSSAGTGNGFFGWLSGLLPSFDVGTPYVSQDMMANVHKGERILTAEENRAYSANQTGNIVVNNNFTINGTMNSQTQAQIAAQVGMSVNRAMARNT